VKCERNAGDRRGGVQEQGAECDDRCRFVPGACRWTIFLYQERVERRSACKLVSHRRAPWRSSEARCRVQWPLSTPRRLPPFPSAATGAPHPNTIQLDHADDCKACLIAFSRPRGEKRCGARWGQVRILCMTVGSVKYFCMCVVILGARCRVRWPLLIPRRLPPSPSAATGAPTRLVK